jgi:hypothetical protein
LVSDTPSYIALTKALTTLLDRAFTKPYFRDHLSTPERRLLKVPDVPPLPARTACSIFDEPGLKNQAFKTQTQP